MKFRRFIYSFVSVLIAFVVMNAVVWHCWTEKIFSPAYGDGGDLSRLGYLPSFKLQRKNHFDLPRRHISLREYSGQPVDLLTVGDSFSNGGGGGKNRYYQDYIATLNQMTVLNVGMFKQEGTRPFLDPVQTLLILINSGEFDRIAPKAVLLSVSVKQSDLLAHPMDLSRTAPVEKVRDIGSYEYYEGSPAADGNPFSFISTGNLQYLYWTGLRYLAGKTNKSVALAPLNRKLFTVQDDTLLYYRNDVKHIPRINKEALEQINDNLNQVAELLAKRGVKLYFMPCVDKYDLYSPYIANNKQPKNSFFDIFRQLPKQYTFIDTKEILSEKVAQGVRDIYYSDETHWSWKASASIFEKVRFK